MRDHSHGPAMSAADVAAFADRFGVPLSRIIAPPAPGTATEADWVANVDAVDRRLCELVDGVLIEKPRHHGKSVLNAFLTMHVGGRVFDHKLGEIFGAIGGVRTTPSRVRSPDIIIHRGPPSVVGLTLTPPSRTCRVISSSNCPSWIRPPASSP